MCVECLSKEVCRGVYDGYGLELGLTGWLTSARFIEMMCMKFLSAIPIATRPNPGGPKGVMFLPDSCHEVPVGYSYCNKAESRWPERGDVSSRFMP